MVSRIIGIAAAPRRSLLVAVLCGGLFATMAIDSAAQPTVVVPPLPGGTPKQVVQTTGPKVVLNLGNTMQSYPPSTPGMGVMPNNVQLNFTNVALNGSPLGASIQMGSGSSSWAGVFGGQLAPATYYVTFDFQMLPPNTTVTLSSAPGGQTLAVCPLSGPQQVTGMQNNTGSCSAVVNLASGGGFRVYASTNGAGATFVDAVVQQAIVGVAAGSR